MNQTTHKSLKLHKVYQNGPKQTETTHKSLKLQKRLRN